jgi:di/tricarboxylate transporter
MTLSIALVLTIIVVALILFAFEWVAADVVALGILLVLIFTGLLPAQEAFLGFGSDTVLMLLGLFILTAALLRTGVVEWAGRLLLQYTGDNPNRLFATIMIAPASLSTVISNTAATAFFLPVVLGVAKRTQTSPSRLLMPLAFASILSSSVTLISTSTNIVISGLLTQYQLPPMGMFELTPVGLPILIVGLTYMFLVGRRLIPDHGNADGISNLGNRLYLSEMEVRPDSPLVGKTLLESGLGRTFDLKVLWLVRGDDRYFIPHVNRRLQVGDLLLVEGQREEILQVESRTGMTLRNNIKLSDPGLKDADIQLAEVMIMPRSPLIGLSLREYQFRDRYGLQVLALYRHGETIRQKIGQIPLRVGDVLLIQGHRTSTPLMSTLEEENVFQVLGTVEEELPLVKRAPLAVAIFAGVLVAAALNLLALPVAVLLGALLVFLTRCITPEAAYRQVEWRALILIGSMLAIGRVMQSTGTDQFLADQIVSLLGTAHPLWLLTGFFVLAVALTQPMSNQAAAIVVVPIAIQAAIQLGLNPRTFVMMIAIAASTSYLTPLEPSCLLVYGPGNYRFVDFLKVGALLTLLIYLVSIVLVPMIWPLF